MDAFGTAGAFNGSAAQQMRRPDRTHRLLAFEGARRTTPSLVRGERCFDGSSEGRPAAEGGSGREFEKENNLYESVNGRLRLVNVFPDGTTHANATFGGVDTESV